MKNARLRRDISMPNANEDSITRIFVAEDDPAMRSMLAVSLRHKGFGVVECASGKVLLERLAAAYQSPLVPDLVVSDVRMPGKSGLEVLGWLRIWLPSVPTILITSFGDEFVHHRGRALGAAAVLNKPFTLSELHHQISLALAEGA